MTDLDWGLVGRQVVGTLRLEIRRALFARRAFAVYFLAFAPVMLVLFWAISPFPTREFDGIQEAATVFAVMFMIFTLSSIGMPALNGFIGEFTILAGAFQIVPAMGGKIFAILGATGIVLGAAYMLWLYQRTMFGNR